MKTILLLEDDLGIVKMLRFALKSYRLLEAVTGEQALGLFAAENRYIDLLIADLTLPTISGVRVAKFLRADLPGLPVILTSGYPVGNWGDYDLADLRILGENSLQTMQKPFHVSELAKMVRQIIGKPAASSPLTFAAGPN